MKGFIIPDNIMYSSIFSIKGVLLAGLPRGIGKLMRRPHSSNTFSYLMEEVS